MADLPTNHYQFLMGAGDLSGDPTLRLMAECVADQQSAGFKNSIDLRKWLCPTCRAAGFNVGWGYRRFVCGAEILNDGEDTESKPCGGRAQAPLLTTERSSPNG